MADRWLLIRSSSGTFDSPRETEHPGGKRDRFGGPGREVAARTGRRPTHQSGEPLFGPGENATHSANRLDDLAGVAGSGNSPPRLELPHCVSPAISPAMPAHVPSRRSFDTPPH